MNLQHVSLQLCTCTWIEIMTCVGLVLYLLYMQKLLLGVDIGVVCAVDRIPLCH